MELFPSAGVREIEEDGDGAQGTAGMEGVGRIYRRKDQMKDLG